MRKLGVFLLIIACIAILGFSYITWKDKLASASTKQADAAPLIEEKEEMEETPDSIEEVITKDQLENLITGMDDSVQEIFLDRFERDEKVQLLIAGSEAMDAGEPGYGETLEAAIEEAYAGFVEVDRVPFNGTSAEFMEEDIDLSSGYDVVLLEPFTLNNNGLVEIEVEHEHILAFYNQIQSKVSDTVLLLQPPQPIFGAGFYLTQVNALEEFALLSNIVYINHWSAWPGTTDPALQDYLTEEGNPNDTGALTWTNELEGYFIAE
ncbi:SGNH/GDSL hydrolase family protein [Planomicrobium sp. CPCC 101110]|uniref:SGNH/GDSL hydrolase family protein n=1 Tax=Planomicrobium sp. CPCC 101110 TaxID=2599619 RepID=UPI00210779A8|nr:SGNH/GDSL hydrolase family protein [Planomicrobium sp. CPCC 101110]